MRFYEKTNGQIEWLDFSEPQPSNDKLVFKLDDKNRLTYHVCAIRNDEIRLYDIQGTKKSKSVSSHYQSYDRRNHRFVRLGKTEAIRFLIPDDYLLTHPETIILQFIDQIQVLKQLTSNNLRTHSFRKLMIKCYHEYALSFIEIALKTLNIIELKNALAIHWHAINGNALCYTALPNDFITILFCDIAEFLGRQLGTSPISLLMPTVSTESQFSDFPDLTALDIKTILRTHILGQYGTYLIPISLFTKREGTPDTANAYPTFELPSICMTKLISPYYQYDLHGENAYLDTRTQERLFSYCPETEVIFEAIQQHQAFMLDDQNLLGQLMRLTHLLKQNSVHGSGREDEAGKNGFVAITAFFDYYNQLTHAQQSIIPDKVKQIITKILGYGTTPTRNDDGSIIDRSTELDTCIASISADLSVALSSAGNQKTLSDISISDQKKGELLHQLQIQFEQGQIDLGKMMQAENHTGQDKLNITSSVLTLLSLDNHFFIKSEKGLTEFMKLSPDEIGLICSQLSHIQYDIVDIIGHTENLVFFIFQHSIEKISVLLSAISDALFDSESGIIADSEDIAIILGPFRNNTFNTLLTLFINYLRTNIKTVADLLEFITPLSENQRQTVYQNLIDTLPNLVHSAYDFNCLAKELDESCLATFYEQTKARLLLLTTSASGFRKITQYLHSSQRTDFYELFKIKLALFIRCGGDFDQIGTYLTNDQRCELFDAIKDKLLWLIRDALDFNHLAKNLDTIKRAAFFDTTKARLSPLITTTDHLYLVIEYLNPAQQFFIFEKMHANFPSLMRNTPPLEEEALAKLNRDFEHYLVTRFFNLFPSLRQGSIASIQALLYEARRPSKNKSGLFASRKSIYAALEELGITDRVNPPTAPTFYEKINAYLSEMEKTTSAATVRRQRE